MVTNTVRSTQDTNQRYCSHCNMVHANTSSRNIRKNRAPHCRGDRQNPLISNSLRCHCQNVNKEVHITSGPSDSTEINTSLKTETASNTFHQQVSHLTAHNTVSCLETYLVTDTVTDGHKAFFTTLQVITSQGCKPLHIKVDPGTKCS